MEQKVINVGQVKLGNKLPLALIAGPCQIESRQHAIFLAGKLVEITKKLGIPYIFKASFDKANRTSINSARGVGLEEGMKTFEEIRKLYPDLPILTDIHEREQCPIVAQYVDMLQIPAFLCRQTDLVVAAAQTGKAVNIKKGQFLAPWDVPNIVKKVEDSGNCRICITERGTSFGYNTLVTDMRAFPQMGKACGYPLIFDATHSVQQPGGLGGKTGGQREFAPVLARAAVAVGVAAVFIETHENP
ncbi:MAG: 3-deoxy-8-phosphooctulonate synthase, partial [Alphaproteobacteria bacterium]|nr:3-deoxy-8-phosphooctulonate synthase [Alphaproteobacteria bacterium]